MLGICNLLAKFNEKYVFACLLIILVMLCTKPLQSNPTLYLSVHLLAKYEQLSIRELSALLDLLETCSFEYLKLKADLFICFLCNLLQM